MDDAIRKLIGEGRKLKQKKELYPRCAAEYNRYAAWHFGQLAKALEVAVDALHDSINAYGDADSIIEKALAMITDIAEGKGDE